MQEGNKSICWCGRSFGGYIILTVNPKAENVASIGSRGRGVKRKEKRITPCQKDVCQSTVRAGTRGAKRGSDPGNRVKSIKNRRGYVLNRAGKKGEEGRSENRCKPVPTGRLVKSRRRKERCLGTLCAGQRRITSEGGRHRNTGEWGRGGEERRTPNCSARSWRLAEAYYPWGEGKKRNDRTEKSSAGSRQGTRGGAEGREPARDGEGVGSSKSPKARPKTPVAQKAEKRDTSVSRKEP